MKLGTTITIATLAYLVMPSSSLTPTAIDWFLSGALYMLAVAFYTAFVED